MKALLAGDFLGALTLFKAADKATTNLMVIEDDGSLIDVTADTVAVEIYQNNARDAAASLSISATIVTATAGLCSISPTDVETDTLNTGTYQYYVKWTEADGTIHMSGPGICTVK